MRSWPSPDLPRLSVAGPEVALHDTSTNALVTTRPDGPARMYVCGITPYDATHIGHAATYVAFDLLLRAWRNAGHEVSYVQNVTDVDDPLLERATKVGVDWVELAERETELFRQDMTALRVAAAGPLRRRGRVDLARRRADRAAPGCRRGLPGGGRPLLLGHQRPGVRRGVPDVPRGDAAAVPRAWRRPRARGQEGPSRLRRLARRAARASLPGRARSAAAVRAGTSSAPRSPSTCSARPSTSRAGDPTWSSRTTRCAPTRRQVATGRPLRAGLRARRDGRPRRREDVEVPRQPGLRQRAAAQRGRSRWRSG